MADINLAAQALINGITNDAKSRTMTDFSDSSDISATSSSQFMNIMTSARSSISGNSDDNSDDSNNVSSDDQNSSPYSMTTNNSMQYSYTVQNGDAAQQQPVQTASVKSTIVEQAAARDRVQKRIQQMSAQDNTQVKDTKALKALQQVASYLVQANADGKVNLPPQMVQKLKDFLAKGDDLKASDITQFMHDFGTMFRQLTVAVPAAPATPTAVDGTAAAAGANDGKGLTWSPEILSALKDLGLQAKDADGSKPLSVVDILRTVKSLVNASESAAVKTLDDKSKEAALPQDQAALLVAGSVAATGVTAPVVAKNAPAATATPDATAAIAAASAAVIPADSGLKKSVKDIQQDADKLLAADAKIKAADDKQTVSAPAAKILAASKTPVVSANEKISAGALMSGPAKSPAKVETASLTKLAGNNAAQSNNNNNSSFDDNRRDNNPHDPLSAIAQIKSTPAAVVVPPPVSSDTKADASDLTSATDQVGPITAPTGMEGISNGITSVDAKAAIAAPTGPQLPSAVTQQVIAQIQVRADKSSTISVQLTPAELGQVEIRLNIQKDGQVHTVVMADKPETLALLQKDSSQLERSLQGAGLNASSENMSFNLRDQNAAQQFTQGRKRFTRENISNNTVTEVTLNATPEGQIFTDNRVNYHA
jgi:hypothetical protein